MLKRNLENKNNKGKIAIFEISVLIISIFAFSFLLGGIGFVDAATNESGEDNSEDGTEVSVDEGEEDEEEESEEYYVKDSRGNPTQIKDKYIEEDDEGNPQVNKEGLAWLGKMGKGVGTSILTSTLTKEGKKVLHEAGLIGKDGSLNLGGSTEAAKDAAGGTSLWEFLGGGGEAFGDGFFSGEIGPSGGGFGMVAGYIAVSAAGAYLTATIFSLAGVGERNMEQVKQGAWIAGGGTAVASIGLGLLGAGPPGWFAGAAAAFFTSIYAGLNLQQFVKEKISFVPGAWKPVDGGEHCEECNDLRYGCSEYQCNTFGKDCGIVNKGTDKERCIHMSPDDTTPPKISALNNSLPQGFKYIPKTIESTSPPTRGVQIVPENPEEQGQECIPPYTGLSLGINTSEPAECRMDVKRRDSYENMMTSLGSYKQYEHRFSLPSSATPSGDAIENSFRSNESSEEIENLLEDFNLEEANDYEFYIRCKDSNGNIAPQSFVMEVCVDDGPDTQAPEILGTNYDEESYIEYNESSVNLEVKTNEPAKCRWDDNDVNFESMEHNISEQLGNELGHYMYGGELTGIKNREENTFYIRCQDKPWWNEDTHTGKPFANKESYELTLTGTEPLLIDEATINGKENGTTLKDSISNVNVGFEIKTSSGANHGEAKCYYGREKGQETILFYNEGETGYSSTNIQKDLSLSEGNHTYYFKCVDEGGNTAKTRLDFTIDVDRESPEAVRAYKGDDSLRITTNEEGSCVYSNKEDVGCSYEYDEGVEMDSSRDSKVHITDWDSEKTFYIKCKDKYDNRDLPGECSIVVRPFEI